MKLYLFSSTIFMTSVIILRYQYLDTRCPVCCCYFWEKLFITLFSLRETHDSRRQLPALVTVSLQCASQTLRRLIHNVSFETVLSLCIALGLICECVSIIPLFQLQQENTFICKENTQANVRNKTSRTDCVIKFYNQSVSQLVSGRSPNRAAHSGLKSLPGCLCLLLACLSRVATFPKSVMARGIGSPMSLSRGLTLILLCF